jgi:hypothetical protein
MSTSVKIMLNDKDAILELAKDPEVEAKVKAAIVDEVGKRAAKAAQAALGAAIADVVDQEIRKFTMPSRRDPNNLFTQNTWGNVTLKPEVVQKIRDHVREELTRQVWDVVDEFPEREEVRKELRKQVDFVKSADVNKMLRESVERVVKEKFK